MINPTGNFYDYQGLPDTTDVELNDSTYFMYEFIELFVGETIVEGSNIPSKPKKLPILYKSNETDFAHNGLGLLRDTIKAPAIEELNGRFELQIEYPINGFLADVIDKNMIIRAKANDKQNDQLFRINAITKNMDNDSIIIDAQHITYDLAHNFVEKMEANKITKKQVMEKIGASTAYKHPFNLTSTNTTTISSTSLYRTNPLQMVGGMEGSILQIWGGQIERDNFNLVLHDRRGHDDGVLVKYRKNLTGLEARFDYSDLVTRIYPFKMIDETDDEPARLITVEGKYIDSPHVDDYDKPYILPVDFSNEEDVKTSKDLYNVAKDWFKKTNRDKAKASLEVEFEHLWETEEYKDLAVLELVGMGDTITIEHEDLGIYAKATINYIEYDVLSQTNNVVKAGNARGSLTDSVNRVDDVVKKVDKVEQSANQAIISANGKNTVNYGPDEPSSAQKDDLWFKVVDGEYTQTYRFDGIQWQLVIDMDVNQAKVEAEKARNRANEAVDNANLATQNAQDAISQAQSSFDKAQNALDASANASLTADNAFSKAQESFDKADALSLVVDDQTQDISTLKQTAQGLQSEVADNAGNISTITQIAEGLQRDVSDAQGNITTLQQTSESFANRITDAEGNISSITQIAEGMQRTISDNKGNINKTTELANALQNRMTDAEGNINTLTRTASSLESTIKNIEMGGTNLVPNTDFSVPENVDCWVPISPASSVKQFQFDDHILSFLQVNAEPTSTGDRPRFRSRYNLSLEKGQTYTLSWIGNVRGYLSSDFNYTGLLLDGIFVNNLSDKIEKTPIESLKENGITRTLYKYKVTFNFKGDTNDNYALMIGTTATGDASGQFIRVSNVQIEKGEYVSDWSPSPIDTQSQITQLSNNINARVKKGDIINQINISDEAILIDGEKVHITGQTTIDDASIDGAKIKDASIGTAQIGSIDARKLTSGEINTNNITIFGGNSRDYTRIDGSFFESRGRHRRTWRGKTNTHDIKLKFEKGYLRARNDSKNWSLYFSDYGISTYADAEGNADASGTLAFRDHTYSDANSVMLHSHYGVVSLKSEANRVVLDANATVNIESETSSIYLRPMRNSRVGNNEFRFWVKDNDSSSDTDGVLTYGSPLTGFSSGLRFEKTTKGRDKVWVTDGDGNKNSADLHADRVYADLAPKYNFAYVRAERTRFVHGSDNENYADIQFKHAQVDTIRVNESGANLYLGTSTGEVRITDNNRWETPINYRPIRASKIYETSSEKYKKDIKKYEGNAIDLINSAVIYDYEKDGSNGREIGLIIERETPDCIVDGDAVDGYSMRSLSWKAIQELDLKANEINEKLLFKIAHLEERISKMEMI